MPYQLNKALLEQTGATTVLHCQPAHREFEITSEVIELQRQNYTTAESYACASPLVTLLNPNFVKEHL